MAAAPEAEELERIKTLVPISTLSEKDRAQLLQQIGIERLQRGEFLFRQGDTTPQNIYLLSGKVDLLLDNEVVDMVADNTETARYPLAHQFPRALSAKAKTPIKYICIDSRKLNELLEHTHGSTYTVDEPNADEEDWMGQLLRSRVFQLIPPASIQNVMMRMEEVKVRKDEAVIQQGEEGSHIYLINKGSCSVTRALNDGDEPMEVAHLGPGDSFGEEALLSNSLRSSTVTMSSDGVLLRLGKTDFSNFIMQPLAIDLSYEDACKAVDAGAVWLDVREPEDYELRHLPSSINHPFDLLRFQTSDLTRDRRYIIYCADGQQSTVAAFLLLERGFDVALLRGGISSVQPEEPSSKDELESRTTDLEPGAQTVDANTSEDSSKLIKERDEAKAQVQALTQALKKSEENCVKLKQQVVELEQNQAEPDEQVRTLKSDLRQLQAELEILMSASEESEQEKLNELSALQGQLSDLQQQLAAAQKDKEAAEQKAHALSK